MNASNSNSKSLTSNFRDSLSKKKEKNHEEVTEEKKKRITMHAN
jgi:hypothetical protein